MSLRFFIFVLCSASFSQFAQAHGLSYEQVIKQDLKKYNIPKTPGLLDGDSPVIIDETAAIQLGKALFWDTNVGNNGVACASCHFHAGADARISNQLNTGVLHLSDSASNKTFKLFGNRGGANYTLKAEDFPFFRFENPDDMKTRVFYTDDVVGSAGIYKQTFTAIIPNVLDEDVCNPVNDPINHVGDAQTRQTTARNAPTVINAVFNHRNFWDGRANNEFNGVSAFGPRDKNAKILVLKNGKLSYQKFNLVNASLASQAVAPPIDMIEMSCGGRTFKDIARKLATQKPLANQEVHSEDSVLAQLRDASGIGLNTTYQDLIKKAFNPIYWSGSIAVPYKKNKYSQLEFNFSLFFGLAIQMYESTLISNESKFDSALASMKKGDIVPPSFTEEEKQGMINFSNAHCDLCHSKATFTEATNREIYSPDAYKSGSSYLDRFSFVPSDTNTEVDSTLADVGFFNTSVVPDEFDVGLGGTDPWGNPLSYTAQYLNSIKLKPKKLVDNFVVSPCDFVIPFLVSFNENELKPIPSSSAGCSQMPPEYAAIPKPQIVKQESLSFNEGRLSTLTTGAFKIPTLRNVELTGPYMHNGGMKSLDEVVDFYNRGGNVQNRRHAATLVFEQGFSEDDKKALVTFLKTLTDERVRWEKAPFDHPSLKVANGHKTTSKSGLLDDDYLEIPAVGKKGATTPLKAFEEYLK